MERFYLRVRAARLSSSLRALIVSALLAFLDRPAPAGNSRWISPGASRSCLSERERKEGGGKEETGVFAASSKINGISHLAANAESLTGFMIGFP